MMFAGLRSRWMTARSCAAARASVSGMARSSRRGNGSPPGGDQRGEGLALDELHRKKPDAVGIFDREEGDDVWMIQAGYRPCLPLEAIEALAA
jgi:hypothetical protein